MNVSLNQKSYELESEGQTMLLPKLEYQLMEALMRNQKVYLSTEEVLCKV